VGFEVSVRVRSFEMAQRGKWEDVVGYLEGEYEKYNSAASPWQRKMYL
jgi:hypothetical protein